MSKISKSFNSDKFVASYSVETEHEGLRLDKFMQSYLGTLSRQFIKSKIKKSEITISGRITPHKSSTKVHRGETVTMVTHPRKELDEPEIWDTDLVPMDETPSIIFEDEKILVVSKPPFMVTHPTGRRLFHCVTVYYETIYQKTIHSIHRLDRETSGVLILGKSPQGAQELTSCFENGLVQKCYFLIAHKKKNMNGDEIGSEENGIGEGLKPSRTYQFPFTANERLSIPSQYDKETGTRIFVKSYPVDDHLNGKSAQTHFDLIMEVEDYLLLVAYPKTGRQHQIRVHASAHEFPLVGDKLYNGDVSVFIRFKDGNPTAEDFETLQMPRHALHAYAINFPYAGSLGEKTNRTFFTKIPKDLNWWLQNHLSFTDGDLASLEGKLQEKVLSYFKQ